MKRLPTIGNKTRTPMRTGIIPTSTKARAIWVGSGSGFCLLISRSLRISRSSSEGFQRQRAAISGGDAEVSLATLAFSGHGSTTHPQGLAVRRQPDQCIQFTDDPDFATGTTGIRALQSIDIAVRHPESFAAMQDAIA